MTRALTILIALALFCGAANADDRQVKVTAQTCRDINQLIAQGEIRRLSDEQLVRGFCNLMRARYSIDNERGAAPQFA
jgi:hypothetical protein